jgi:hypothetical protein
MVAATFDGPNLRIILPAGENTINVESDLYSAWKQWVLSDSNNASFPPAFRASVGGDPLSPGIESGAYFFLQNQDGWRIRPAEENNTVSVIGNLVAEEPTLALTVPTLGAFTVLLNGLQPITQSVESLLLSQQDSSYNGTVVIDTIGGVSGVEYPTGLFGQPSDNLTDALSIASRVGADELIIIGSLTLDQSVIGFTLRGSTGESGDILNLNGQDIDGSALKNLEVRGAGLGTVEADFCAISMVSGINGVFRQCSFPDTFTFAAGKTSIRFCTSEVAGLGRPVFDMNGLNLSANIRAYVGGFEVRNMTHASANMTIDFISGAPLLDSSNTGGNIVVRGVGNFTDNSAGSTVTKDGFVDGLDVKLIKALDAGNVTVTGSNPFVVEVLDPDDNVTPIARFNISADGRTRTRTL